MAHVFLSYSSKHRALTKALAERLEAEGHDVWWDRALESWGGYEPQIAQALQAARAVVVIWSAGAAASDFVYSEARKAAGERKLVNARAPDFPLDDIPSPFDVHHVYTLDPEDADQFAGLLRSIGTVWRGEVAGPTPRHVTYRQTYGVDLFSAKREKRPDDLRMLTPAALLQAKYEIAPYLDATGMLANMLDWCRASGQYAEENRATAGRLLHGAGGLGKTRLMIEAASRLREDGWLAGFIEPPKDPSDPQEVRQREQAIQQLFAGGDEPGVLIVVDYAEGRQPEVQQLAKLARPRPREDVRPVRIVLLARGDAWWPELYDREVEVEILFQRFGHRHGDVVGATPPPAGEDRRAAFEAMLAAYRPLTEALAGAGAFPSAEFSPPDAARLRRLAEEPGFARPLALQMEALLHLAGEGGAGGIEALLDRIVRLERRHWTRVIAGLAGDDAREESLRRGVAQITAVGGAPARRPAEDLFAADPHYGPRAPATLPWRDLHRLYGLPNGGLAAIEPDLVGEHEIALSADERLVDGCIAWIESLPEAERGARRRTLVTVLQRASRAEHGRAAEAAVAMLDRLIFGHMETCAGDLVAVTIETPGRLVERLTEAAAKLEELALTALSMHLPSRTFALLDVVAAVAEADLAFARHSNGRNEDDTESLDALAVALNKYGKSLYYLGRREDALKALNEATSIYRQLARVKPDVAEPNLAAVLSNLGVNLSDVGRLAEALKIAEESVSIYRQLAVRRPDEFKPAYALSLGNLGIWLSNLGRREEALAATKEAADFYCDLAAMQPQEFEPDFSRILNNLGVQLSNLELREDALAATNWAVKIRRRLSLEDPDQFEHDLAISLNNLGSRLSELSRHEEGIEAVQEAIFILRRLSAARPNVFESDFARSLSNLAVNLARFGKLDEATAASNECISIIRKLAKEWPSTFEPELARCLNNVSQLMFSVGNFVASENAAQEGIAQLAPHLERHPTAHHHLMRLLEMNRDRTRRRLYPA